MKGIQTDERTTHRTGQLAVIFLSLTQLGLLGAILYRRYFLHADVDTYGDLRWILGISVFGFIAVRILAGAHIPVIRIRVLIGFYLAFVIGLSVVLSIWHGPPTPSNWTTTILPVTLGPAIILAAYVLLGAIARNRAKRYYSED